FLGAHDNGGAWTFGGNPHSNNFTPGTDAAGVYTYTVTGTTPCANAAATVTVGVTTAPNAGTNGAITVCATDAAFSLFAQLGGTPDLGGSWSGPSAVVGGNYDPATMDAGVYTYQVNGAGPCGNSTATVTVTENVPANAGSNGSHTVCVDAAAFALDTYLGTHDAGGNWTFGGNPHSGTFTPGTDVAGVYTYTVSSAAPCANVSATVTVTVNDLPVVDAGSYGPFCSTDAPIALNAGSPAGGSFSGTGVTVGNFDPSVGTQTIVYSYTDGNSCSNSASTTINVTPATAWYQDTDGDTYGAGAVTMACTSPGPDYVTDNSDDCPSLFGRIGDSCNDNNPFTANDVITGACACAGTPVPSHNWTIRIVTDANGGETSYEVREFGSNFLLASGGPFPSNSTINQVINMPDAGHFKLTVFDSGNNGIGNGGGYMLRDHNGKRVIDNLGNGAGFTSISESPEGFYSPVGTDGLREMDCDNVEHWPFDMIAANANAAVSAQWQVGNQTDDGYEFWFTEPNGSYSRHIFRNHATSGGYAPANAQRATKLGLNSWVTNPLPQNVLLNCRIRSRVNGVNADFGPACRMRVDQAAANCHTTQLDNFAGPTLSCGVTGLRTNGSSRIWAKPVTRYIQATNTLVSANRYRFHFVNVGENTTFDLVQNSYPMQIYPQMPFQLGATYTVTVQASFDGGSTYCPVGAACQISFAATNQRMEEEVTEMPAAASDLLLWPNPNRGDELFLNMATVAEGVDQVTIDVTDMYGKRVMGRTLPVSNGSLNAVVSLGEQLASGLYLVNLTAGDQTITKRLVIQR
ncbi:MAG TPA: T9SS type A sorting domain-containing protein, partial [Flavobacteriales bacterium]|nr:T9SS type A sorting domain-containing protein [Flavobacteriales bacterium]